MKLNFIVYQLVRCQSLNQNSNVEMEEIQECLKNIVLLENSDSALAVDKFYQELASFNNEQECSQLDKILKSIQELYSNGKISRHVLYLTLLSNTNNFLINELVKYENALFKLLEYPGSLYDFILCNNKQWFELSIDHKDLINIFDQNSCNIVDVLKLVKQTNKPLNLNKNKIKIKHVGLNEFWRTYCHRIKCLWDVIEYCKSIEPSIDANAIFIYSGHNACLKVLSNFLDVEKFNYDDVVNILQKEDEIYDPEYSKQVDNILAYSILHTILKAILEIKSISNVKTWINNIKEKLLSINHKKLIIEILENIFTILFTTENNFSNGKKLDVLLCQECEIRLILILLKELLDETKFKSLFNVNSEEYFAFLNIQKHVTNALWRMELITKVKIAEKCERKLLKYMLAMPESLIQMCLKGGDYERAYQVVQIFSLKDALSIEIDYCQKLRRLKQSLEKTFKLKALQEANPEISKSEISIEQIVKAFFMKNPVISNPDHENFIRNSDIHFLKHFKEENTLFYVILDLAITQPTNFVESETMLHLAFEFNKLDVSISSKYSEFSRKLCDMITTEEYPRTSLRNMLASGYYSLDINKYVGDNELYTELTKFYEEFQEKMCLDEIGVLNSNHPSHMIALKISNVCNMASREGEINTKYLYKLLNYMKAFSKVLYIEKNNSDIISKGKNASFFNILCQNRSELIGKLLFERNLDPDEFERYFGKLKLDYLYHVIGNCFPTINLHTKECLTEEELYPENNLYIPKRNILTYIQKRNWLLAFILNEMYQVEGVNIGITENRVKNFSNYSKLWAVKNLTEIHKDCRILTAIQNEINLKKLRQHVFSELSKFESVSETSDSSEMAVEIGEDITENLSRRNQLAHLLDIIDSISEIQLKKNKDLMNLRDLIIVKLLEECENFHYVESIANKNSRMGIILKTVKHWPGVLCIDLLKSELTKFEEVHNDELRELISWFTQIVFYEELKDILGVSEWSEALDMCHNSKDIVISKLLKHYAIQLLQNFITFHTPDEELLFTITEAYLLEVFERIDEYDHIGKLLDSLPFQYAVKVCYGFLGKLKKIPQLEYVIGYLLRNISNDEYLKKIQVSLKILKELSPNEHEQLLDLRHDPMSIIEVLLMNVKLEKLSVALNILRSEVIHYEFSDDSISNEKIDFLLRKYAEKSLDFRVISHPNPRLLRTPECKLLQSLDTLSVINDLNREFIMPYKVPSKEDWVSNDEVIECMCCQKTTFSMFYRRHHCRRCGRVICYYCSNHRMLVPTYGDILVRVCTDCHRQTLGESTSSSDLNDSNTSTKSTINDFWLLTGNPNHNEIVRAEFSFEDAPSISLCLSIMKFHRKTPEYPKLLLDQCGVLLRLLQPNHENVEEIDYFLVIKMLKHLATAAKMASVECTEHYGISSADRILSQADLLNLFVERGCLNLLPAASSNFSQPSYIDASILRRLCDKLLEKEQWNLALEVSTKAGLDRTGVFSAWGKNCLRAGNLFLARDIFHRCLDKTGFNESTSDLSIASDSYDSFKKSTSLSKSSIQTGFETKTSKNPTLLKEIINILESNMKLLRPNSTEASQKQVTCSTFILNSPDTDNAIYILNKMKNLRNLTEGNYNQSDDKYQFQHFSRKSSPNVFYDECIYYLGKYGTHLNLLEFLIKNGNAYEALKYIVESQLNSDVFIHVYLKCLKDGLIGILQGYILTIDSSFEIWKDYLRNLCRHLVKQHMLHSLYQLQQFMGDHVRAAMTCIKFYQENANNFADLLANTNYLIKAEQHLNDLLEQEQWVELSPVQQLSTSRDIFEEKSVNNSSLIMKMTPDDINTHINTISKQKDIVKFLSEREKINQQSIKIVLESLQTESHQESTSRKQPFCKIPTLFGSTTEKNKLAVLALLSGENVEDGFKLGQTIIEDFNLKAINIYCEVGKILAKFEKYNGISQLVSCIKQMGTNNELLNHMCDEMLTLAVATLSKANCSGTKVEDLIKLVSDRPTKISAYIEAKQLKTAYFLAVKYKRTTDIKRIMKEAELLNQPNIKILCQKVLQNQHHPSLMKK